MALLPPLRIRSVNAALPRPDGEYILYWMISARRLRWNYALDRALHWARELGRPLLVFEPLRLNYRWASVRMHRFCIEGMLEHRSILDGSPVGYLPYVEPSMGAGKGLLEALAERASVVVTDTFPSFFLPAMVEAAGRKLPVRLEAVDGNGIVPLEAPGRDFTTAHSFRRHLQKTLPAFLEEAPIPSPLERVDLPRFSGLPVDLAERWPSAPLTADPEALATLGLDREVGPVPFSGGPQEARRRLQHFLKGSLHRYAEDRNHPDLEVTSGLSPFLHWGHLGAHEVLHAVLEREGWTPARLSAETRGSREGWWGVSPSAEAFLDQLVTWRELGYNTAHRRGDAALEYASLPDWALQTLEEHRRDLRPHLYERSEFEAARTHDPLWNAAQRELRQTGVIHNYLRMLWGKKILEWSASPEEALDTLIHLNNRWGIDGRNPNSTSGIFWTLGRYDRGWPERPVFGTVRSMSSDSTRRKVDLRRYLARFSYAQDPERP